MNKWLFYKGLFLSGWLFFASCEGNTDFNWLLENESSFVIEAEYGRTFEGDTLLSVVDPGSSIVMSTTSKLGGDPSPNLPSSTFNYFLVINESGDTLQIDMMDPNQWDVDIKERSRIPSDFLHTYRMIITDDDF